MRLIKNLKFILALILIIITTPSFATPQTIINSFNQAKKSPDTLSLFLQNMPKGGDLHIHLGGAFYDRNLLDDAENSGLCLDIKTTEFVKQTNCPDNLKIKNILKNSKAREHIIDTWSMADFSGPEQARHDHFFNTFHYFSKLYRQYEAQVLASVLNRAANEKEIYMEPMVSTDVKGLLQKGNQVKWSDNYNQMIAALDKLNINQNVNKINLDTQKLIRNKNKLLACHTQHPQAGCKMTVRFLYQVLRNMPPNVVFTELLAGFRVAARDPQYVGINMVQPEDGFYSLRDYTKQMRMIGYLHKLYPQVNITLHAGELVPGLVPPKDLRFHIRQAINIAHAQRIGHGADIIHENNAISLLKEMARKHILVEINLTSNADILGLKGKAHPFPLYLRYHVPVTLSTDDEGVEHTDLTREYKRAILTYHLSYPQVKMLVRNSISYAFLPGKNLWANRNKFTVVPACHQDRLGARKLSKSCQNFLDHSQKARLQWRLESEFYQFEHNKLT